MSESAEDIREHVRVYVTVFVALACLTVVTVAISYIGMRTALAICVAMVVATVKAGLVAGYFMHLITEQRVIIWLLALCAAFVVFLMFLPLSTEIGIAPLWPPSGWRP